MPESQLFLIGISKKWSQNAFSMFLGGSFGPAGLSPKFDAETTTKNPNFPIRNLKIL